MEPTAVMTNHATWPTLSRNRAGAPTAFSVRAYPRGKRDLRTLVFAMSLPRPEADADGGEYDVDREECDDAEHQRLVHRGADALGTACHRQASVAADETGDQPERHGLDDRDEHFGQA